MKQLEPPSIAGRSINWYNNFRRILGVSYKVNYAFTHGSELLFLKVYFKMKRAQEDC
jgi:hypothetical protein